MKEFSNILKQFSQKQKIFVLFLLLFFTTFPLVFVQWLKTDDCTPIIDENIKMHEDFAKISEILRQERMKSLKTFILDTTIIGRKNFLGEDNVLVEEEDPNLAIDKVIEISESHLKK